MANPNEINSKVETGSKTPEKKTSIIKATAVALVLTATQVQANDLLAQCDFNGDGVINTRPDIKSGKATKQEVIKEVRCKSKYNIAQGEKRIAQLDTDIAQGREDIANLAQSMLNNLK